MRNIALDALFVVGFKMGLKRRGYCDGCKSDYRRSFSYNIFSACKNGSLLRFSKPKWYGRIVAKSCVNGSSELVGNIAMSLVSMIYNVKLLEIAEHNGVSAFGVIMYVQFIFVAIFIGYCIGTAPIVGI